MELADLLAGHVGVPQRSLHDADDVEGPSVPAGQLDVDLGVPDVDQRSTFGCRPRARSRASSISALASSLMALAAASPYAAGRTAVALVGQWTTTCCGVSAGLTSSIAR